LRKGYVVRRFICSEISLREIHRQVAHATEALLWHIVPAGEAKKAHRQVKPPLERTVLDIAPAGEFHEAGLTAGTAEDTARVTFEKEICRTKQL